MNTKDLIQNLYLRIFQEHLFTTLGKLNQPSANAAIQLAYGKNYGVKLWNWYPKKQNHKQQDILFVHIPKCAGTSIANGFGWNDFRHIPAYYFWLTNKQRFLNSESFTVIREPLTRVASMLSHYSKSYFSSDIEKKVAEKLDLTEDNLQNNLYRYLTDKDFRFKLMDGTTPGRTGFSVNQWEYLTWKDTLLVKHIFAFDRLDHLETWLSSHLETSFKLPHSNSSKRRHKLIPDSDLVKLAREKMVSEYKLYDQVMANDGALHLPISLKP